MLYRNVALFQFAFEGVIVADNGSGVPDAHVGRIFELFYTTKEESGNGLGWPLPSALWKSTAANC